MEPHLAQSIEIETIAELLPELNYYQILQVDPLAPANVIEKSYRSEARRLHPDRYARNPDEQTKKKGESELSGRDGSLENPQRPRDTLYLRSGT